MSDEEEDQIKYQVQYFDGQKEASDFIVREGECMIQYKSGSIFIGKLLKVKDKIFRQGEALMFQTIESPVDDEEEAKAKDKDSVKSDEDKATESVNFQEILLKEVQKFDLKELNPKMFELLTNTQTFHSFYQGEMECGIRSGKGKITYLNGDSYSGDWIENQKHGFGTYLFKESGDVYSGNWKDNKRHGIGTYIFYSKPVVDETDSVTYTLKQDNCLQGVWREDSIQEGRWVQPTYLESPDRKVWFGQFKSNQPFGSGQIITENEIVDCEFFEESVGEDEQPIKLAMKLNSTKFLKKPLDDYLRENIDNINKIAKDLNKPKKAEPFLEKLDLFFKLLKSNSKIEDGDEAVYNYSQIIENLKGESQESKETERSNINEANIVEVLNILQENEKDEFSKQQLSVVVWLAHVYKNILDEDILAKTLGVQVVEDFAGDELKSELEKIENFLKSKSEESEIKATTFLQEYFEINQIEAENTETKS